MAQEREKALKQWNRAGQSGEEKKILLMYNQNIQAYCLCVNLFLIITSSVLIITSSVSRESAAESLVLTVAAQPRRSRGAALCQAM